MPDLVDPLANDGATKLLAEGAGGLSNQVAKKRLVVATDHLKKITI